MSKSLLKQNQKRLERLENKKAELLATLNSKEFQEGNPRALSEHAHLITEQLSIINADIETVQNVIELCEKKLK